MISVSSFWTHQLRRTSEDSDPFPTLLYARKILRRYGSEEWFAKNSGSLYPSLFFDSNLLASQHPVMTGFHLIKGLTELVSGSCNWFQSFRPMPLFAPRIKLSFGALMSLPH